MTISNGKKLARALPGGQLGVTPNGNDFVLVTFVITDGPESGESLNWRGFFTDKTADRTIESLRYCGWGGNDITDLVGLGDNVVQIVVENETYEGKTYPKVQWVNRAGGGGIKPEQQMDGQAKKAFAARMRGAVMAVPAALASEGMRYEAPATVAGGGGGGNGGEAGGGGGGGGGFGDDDIPF